MLHTQDRSIKIHDSDSFAAMRAAGLLAAKTLDYITPFIKPGISTNEIDVLVNDFTLKNAAIPAPLGYRGFPKSVCTSVNHVVCHGIPSDKRLEEGDIINIDVTPILNDWHGDTSRMFFVGKVGIKAKKLVDTTFKALWKGIEVVKPGAHIGDIGHAIQTFAEKHRYSIVKDFCGHGVGKIFHDAPNIMHFGQKGEGAEIKKGMIFTIEPMINAGKPEVKILTDGWTAVTKDRSLSAQFEHTIGVTSDGFEVFTASPKGLDAPPYEL